MASIPAPQHRYGLVTGFTAFAGLPSNPAELTLAAVDGMTVSGIRIVTAALPVSRRDLPARLAQLLAAHRPAFVLCLGLAVGAAVVRVETVAVNAARFLVSDNDGDRPLRAEPIEPAGPAARAATWDGHRLVETLRAEGIPSMISFHAGTHLCNFTLYTMLGLLEAARTLVPCGFLHLPCLPDQVVWMMRNSAPADRLPMAPTDIASMSADLQVRAVRAAATTLARAACGRGEARPA